MRAVVVTIVGKGYDEEFEWILTELAVKTVNTVNSGMLGNFATLTYYLEIPENDIIVKRRELMNKIRERLPQAMALYMHGDWNRIFIMKRFRIQNTP